MGAEERGTWRVAYAQWTRRRRPSVGVSRAARGRGASVRLARPRPTHPAPPSRRAWAFDVLPKNLLPVAFEQARKNEICVAPSRDNGRISRAFSPKFQCYSTHRSKSAVALRAKTGWAVLAWRRWAEVGAAGAGAPPFTASS